MCGCFEVVVFYSFVSFLSLVELDVGFDCDYGERGGSACFEPCVAYVWTV